VLSTTQPPIPTRYIKRLDADGNPKVGILWHALTASPYAPAPNAGIGFAGTPGCVET
jgi:hypothetical protein